MIITFSNTTEIQTTEGTIWDYPMPNKEIGISYQTLSGRGPAKGRYCNTVCNEIYFIIKGSATFYIAESTHEVREKDVVIVEPNTSHHFETEHLEYITITRPDWYEEQYKAVEE